MLGLGRTAIRGNQPAGRAGRAKALTRMVAAAFAVGLTSLAPTAVQALPVFAHEYGFSCQKCHSVIPRLNAFGQAFMDHGYSLPDAQPGKVFPLSAKLNFVYSSDADPSGLPKAIVDEVEVYLAGKVDQRTNYFFEQYLVDGGVPGSTRDAWVQHRFSSLQSKVPLYLTGGAFSLPVPVDPETFRETAAHYAVFDQTVGDNPFTFFDPKIGLQARIGNTDHGTSLKMVAVQGHDHQSGVNAMGIDTMLTAQQAVGPLSFAIYRYDGSRPTAGDPNRFWRQGYGLSYAAKRWAWDALLQNGYDSNTDGLGSPGTGSGGFLQLRYQWNRKAFALVRYDGTHDAENGIYRDFIPTFGYRFSKNSRLTVEDVVTHVPQAKHTLNTQYTVGY